MKNYITSGLILVVITIISVSKSFGAHDPLNFMVKCNLPLAQSYAKQERKPIKYTEDKKKELPRIETALCS